MKTLISVIALMSLFAQPYKTVIAQTTTGTEKTFKLEQQTTTFELEHEKKEPIYETRQVDDTCYRDVQQGMKDECHTEYDQDCRTSIENECRNIPHDVCTSIPETVCEDVGNQVCENVPEQVCHQESHPVCENRPQQVCSDVPEEVCRNETVPVCEDRQVCEADPAPSQQTHPRSVEAPSSSSSRSGGVSTPSAQPTSRPRGFIDAILDFGSAKSVNGCHTERVCHNETRQSCTTKNNRVCHTENQQSCHTEYSTACKTENRQRCHTQTHQECRTENRQQCHTEYSQVCEDVSRQRCTDIPRQECHKVPNMVKEPYACKRDIQVKVGERLVSKVHANVKIVIANFGKIELPKDELKAVLTGEDIRLSVGKSAKKTIFRIANKELKVQPLSEIEKMIQATFTLELISVDQLMAIKNIKIDGLTLLSTKLQFKILPDIMNGLVEFEKGHIKLIRHDKKFLSRKVKTVELLDQDFDPKKVMKKEKDLFEVNLAAFELEELIARLHVLNVELKPKILLDKSGILNPELLSSLKLQALKGNFEGMPEYE